MLTMKKGWAYKARRPDLGARIKAAREDVPLKQEELADAVGVSRSAVSQWENGQTDNLKIENLFAVARAVRKTVDELVFDESESRVAEESGTYRALRDDSLRCMRILNDLPKEIRFNLAQLISTLAPLTNPNYWEWVQQQEQRVAERDKDKSNT